MQFVKSLTSCNSTVAIFSPTPPEVIKFVHGINYHLVIWIRFQVQKLKCMILVLARERGGLLYQGHLIKPLWPRACFKPSSKVQGEHHSINLITFDHQVNGRRLDFVAHVNCHLGGASSCAFNILLCRFPVIISCTYKERVQEIPPCRFYLKAKTKYTSFFLIYIYIFNLWIGLILLLAKGLLTRFNTDLDEGILTCNQTHHRIYVLLWLY